MDAPMPLPEPSSSFPSAVRSFCERCVASSSLFNVVGRGVVGRHEEGTPILQANSSAGGWSLAVSRRLARGFVRNEIAGNF